MHNSLHPEAHRELDDALDRYAADPDLRVAIMTGAGDRIFCVGSDLKALAATGDHTNPATGFVGITHRFDLWKPVIAAVNGLCLGGMEIVADCDIAKLGLPASLVCLAASGSGLLQRLRRHLPGKDAMWMLLTAELISAERACSRRIAMKSCQPIVSRPVCA